MRLQTVVDSQVGISAVIHVASPFTITFKDAQKELLDPAVKGTQNVLQSAHASGIRRIIVTSSIASVFDLAKGGPFDSCYHSGSFRLF